MHRHELVHGDLKPENVLLADATRTRAHLASCIMSPVFVTLPPYNLEQHQFGLASAVAAYKLTLCLCCVQAGTAPAVKLADLGSCFSTACVDTASLGLEMQSLPYRSPEVRCLRTTTVWPCRGL